MAVTPYLVAKGGMRMLSRTAAVATPIDTATLAEPARAGVGL